MVGVPFMMVIGIQLAEKRFTSKNSDRWEVHKLSMASDDWLNQYEDEDAAHKSRKWLHENLQKNKFPSYQTNINWIII